MSMQTGKSPLAGKLKGLAGAAVANKGKPIEIGRSRLPGGINNGVARLSQIGVSTYEPDHKVQEFRGKPYFSAMGVVASPTEHEGTPVRGLQTWLQREPLFDTPNGKGKRKTLIEHFNHMRSHLIGLGFDVDAAVQEGMTDDQVFEVVKAGCAALEQQKPHFRFRTWQGSKPEIINQGGKWFLDRGRAGKLGPYSSKELLLKVNPYAESDPLVNEQWEGTCEFSENGELTAVEDNTGDSTGTGDAAEGTVEESGGAEAADPGEDLDALAAEAQAFTDDETTSGVNEPGERIKAIAAEHGIEPDAVESLNTWAEAAELIRAAQAPEGGDGDGAAVEEAPAEEEEAAAEEEPWKPELGAVCKYKPADPKNKGKRLKAIEVVVEKVFKNETATVKSNTTKKLLTVAGGANKGKPLAIKWTDLEPA